MLRLEVFRLGVHNCSGKLTPKGPKWHIILRGPLVQICTKRPGGYVKVYIQENDAVSRVIDHDEFDGNHIKVLRRLQKTIGRFIRKPCK